MAELNFDASTIEPSAPIEVLPPGDYPVMIVQSEMQPTKAGDGQYLWLEMDVVDGPHKGRKLWDRLNLVNPNEKAVEIAKRTLSAICHAVGVINVTNSEQLHGKTMLAKVVTRPAKGDFPATNDVKGYKPIPRAATAAAPTQQAQPQQQAQPAQAAAGAPPWQR